MTQYSIDIRPVEGDDALCSAHVGDWSCLVIQSPIDAETAEVMDGEGTEYDNVLIIPPSIIIDMNGDMTEAIPTLVAFVHRHFQDYHDNKKGELND